MKMLRLILKGIYLTICLSAHLLWTVASANTESTGTNQVLPEQNEALLQILKSAVESSDSFYDQYDAEVWLIATSSKLEKFIPDHEQRLSLLKLIHKEAARAGLQPDIVLSVIEVESRFDQFAISRVGAQGLMQVMPFWKNEIGRPEDNLTDIPTNLRYGCTILKYYLDMEKGILRLALARYNGSVGKHWYPELVFDAWDRHWRSAAMVSINDNLAP